MSNINIRILSEPISYQELSCITGWRISGIYKIENITNHKVYIGKSMDIIFRLRFGHNLKYETNTHLLRAFKKYGLDNFSFEVLKLTYDLDYWETFLIQIYNATDERYGYNILPGGEGGDSEVSKRMWKDPKVREKFSNSIKKYWESPEGQEQKRINSERQRGRELSKGKHWYNDGVKNVVAYECPEGFVCGRIGDFSQSEETKQKKSDWYKNLTEEEREEYKQHLSDSHKGKTCSEERKKRISEAKKGKPGREQTDEIKVKIAAGMKGKKRFTNGIIEIRAYECPEGFVHDTLASYLRKMQNSNIDNKE